MTGLVMYTCPLKIGRLAHLYLPSDLTQADIDRIIAMLRTLPPTLEICAEGFHVAESMATKHRRCVKCGHEWVFGSGNPATQEHAPPTGRSEAQEKES